MDVDTIWYVIKCALLIGVFGLALEVAEGHRLSKGAGDGEEGEE